MAPLIALPSWTVWAIVLAVFAAAAVAFWPLVGVSVLAASVGVVLFPLQRRLAARIGPVIAAVLLTVVVGAALIGAAVFTIGVLVQNLDFITEMVRAIFSVAAEPIANPFSATLPLDPAEVTEAIRTELGAFSTFLSSLIDELPMVGLETIVFFLVLYLTLEQGEAAGVRLGEVLPAHVRRPVERLWQMAVDVMYSIFVVHFATAFVTFLIGAAVLLVPRGCRPLLRRPGVFRRPFPADRDPGCDEGQLRDRTCAALLVLFIGYQWRRPRPIMRPWLMGSGETPWW